MTEDLHARAALDPDGVYAELVADRDRAPLSPDQLYLFAQLTARKVSSEAALDLVEEAEVGFRKRNDHLNAARCDSGRSTLLHALGLHDRCIEAAMRWLAFCQTSREVSIQTHVQAMSNLAVYLHAAGRYQEAVDHFALADELLGDADESLSVALDVNRAASLNLLGRCPEAHVALARCAKVLERTGDTRRLSVAAINAGETLHRMGRPDEGLDWFVTADKLLDPADPNRQALCVEMGSALLGIGAVDDAAVRFQMVLDVPAERSDATLQARASHGLAACLAAQGHHEHAAHEFAKASGGYRRAGNRPEEVVSATERLAVLSLSMAQSPHEGAHRYAEARALVSTLDSNLWPVHVSQALVHLGMFVLGSARRFSGLEVATEWLDDAKSAFALATSAQIPAIVAQSAQILGALYFIGDNLDDAEFAIGHAILAADSIRDGLRRDRLLALAGDVATTARETLADIKVARGDLLSALDATDAGRSAATPILLSRSQPQGDGLGELRAELSGVFDRLVRSDVPVTSQLRASLGDRARQLEREIDQAELTAPSAIRRFTNTVLPQSETGSAAVVYRTDGLTVDAFVRCGEDVVLRRRIAHNSAVRNALAGFHSAGRRSVAASASNRPGHEQLAVSAVQRCLNALGAMLLEPLLDDLPDIATLNSFTVVPHGELHGVPFAALPAKGQPLIRSVPVIGSPSLRVQASRPAARTGPFVVVGYDTGDLPGVYDEVNAISAIRPDARVLVGPEATSKNLVAALAGAAGLHVATHGLFRAASPWHSGLRLADRWLTVDDVVRLPLAGSLVVLSACETGNSLVAKGDELLGLQRAFLQAGSRNLFTSAWGAVDAVATICTVTLHAQLVQGFAVPVAAQRALLAASDAYPNPWWWATFGLTGKAK